MPRPVLAREYELPRKPLFLLDDKDVTQSADAAMFVFDSVLDSVMYGTNGNIGLRHRSEVETVGCTTEVMLSGVHHVHRRGGGGAVVAPLEAAAAATPSIRHVGAIVGVVSIDSLVDGVSGTLSTVPTRKLSLRDRSYRSICTDAMSADGGLYFDTDYLRCVSCTEPHLWASEFTMHNLRVCNAGDAMATTAAGGGGGAASAMRASITSLDGTDAATMTAAAAASSRTQATPPATAAAAAAATTSPSLLSPQLSQAQLRNNSSSGAGNNGVYATTAAPPAPSVSSSSSLSSNTYTIEMTTTFAVDLDEWEVLKADRADELWQRSLTSNMTVVTTTRVQCVAAYRANLTRIESQDEIVTCTEDEQQLQHQQLQSDSSPMMAMERYGLVVGGGGGGVMGVGMMGGGGGGSGSMGGMVGGGGGGVCGYCGGSLMSTGGCTCIGGCGGGGTGSSSSFAREERSSPSSSLHAHNHHYHPHHHHSSTPSLLYGGGGGGGGGGVMNNNTNNNNSISYELLNLAPTKEQQRLLVRRRFVLTIAADRLPQSVRLTYMSRHCVAAAVTSVPRPFPASLQVLMDESRLSLDTFWSRFDVDLQLQDELVANRARLPLAYNAYRLYNVSYNLRRGLPRAGYSCAGDGLELDLTQYLYYGIYYTLTHPRCALALLYSLYDLLPHARAYARGMSLAHGALYPTRTLGSSSSSNTATASSNNGSDGHIDGNIDNHRGGNNNNDDNDDGYGNAGSLVSITSARFHVNAEVGYLVYAYLAATESVGQADRLALLELMLETARVWPQLGQWLQSSHHTFCLENITGADDYNNSASGSFYVHLSAKMHLQRAVAMVHEHDKLLGRQHVDALLARLAMTRDELAAMATVADGLWVRRSDRLGVYPVHDSFDTLAPWTSEPVRHPLYLNYHPLTIYRHKVINLPEVLLGMLLYEDAFQASEFESNYAYYHPLCTYDAPKALGIMAIAQCRARRSLAQPVPALRSLSALDVDNILYTADEGLHFGDMAMSLLTLLCGMGGVRLSWQALQLDPILPAGVSHYSFTVSWRGAVLRTTVNEQLLTYELIVGDNVRFIHGPTQHRIHLHTGFRRTQAVRQCVIERCVASPVRQFDGAIIYSDCLFDNLLEYTYLSWLRTLETLFDGYRALQNRRIAPLNPEEFIDQVVYQVEEDEIAFSGINAVLRARQLYLDLGTPDDAEIVETRHGLANAKVAEMNELLARHSPPVLPDLFAMVQALARSGVALALVSYARNQRQQLLCNPELASFFVARIDGDEAHGRQIKGRPHLDLYIKAAEKIHVEPSRCIIVSHHFDRGYSASELARFRMVLDVEDPFVSSRVAPRPYPTLPPDEAARQHRDSHVVVRLQLANIPTTIDDIEDVVDGRTLTDPVS